MRDLQMMKFDSDLMAVGASVRNLPPVRNLWLDLHPGLTVFYGVSGVGKSTLLNALADGFAGVRPGGDGIVDLHLVPNSQVSSELGREVVARLEVLRQRSLGSVATYNFLELRLMADPDLDLVMQRRIEETRADVEPTSAVQLVELVSCAILGRSADLYHSPRIVLRASGSADVAGWTVGISAVPRSVNVAIAHHEERLSTGRDAVDKDDRSKYAALDESERLATHSAVRDQLELQLGGEDVGHEPRPVVIGFLDQLEWEDSDDESDGPVLAVDRSQKCYRAGESFDADQRSVELLLKLLGTAGDGTPDLIDIVADGEFVPSKRLTALARKLSDRATAVVSDLSGEHMTMQLELEDPNWWPQRGLARWVATDQWGRAVPVNSLGSGNARLASLALSLVLGGSAQSENADIFIDEPERALHTAAQHAAATSIERLCSNDDIDMNVLVASHSPAFLGLQNANVVRLDRDSEGWAVSTPLEFGGSIDIVAGQLGITRPDLLLATRWIILVEGEHDASVLRALFAEELRVARCYVVVMDGADNTKLNIARGLMSYSTARVRLVLDGLSPQHLDLWDRAVTMDRDGNVKAARRLLEELRRDPQREVEKLGEAGLAALSLRHLQRIELAGLSEPDIVRYLPADYFVSGGATWSDLHTEFRAAGSPGGPGNFKQWVSEHSLCIKRINRDTVRKAAETLIGDVPAELRLIIENL